MKMSLGCKTRCRGASIPESSQITGLVAAMHDAPTPRGSLVPRVSIFERAPVRALEARVKSLGLTLEAAGAEPKPPGMSSRRPRLGGLA